MPSYWKQTSLKLDARCWDRLRLFAAAMGKTTSDTAAEAIEWATYKQAEGQWSELAKLGHQGLASSYHATALRLSPELKASLRASAADVGVDMMSFMSTALWAYTSGVDAIAESKFRESVKRVAAVRESERQSFLTCEQHKAERSEEAFED